MTLRSCYRKTPHFASIGLAILMATATGCTALQLPDLPALPFSSPASNGYQGIGTDLQLQPSDSEQLYHSVRQARSQNAIVLQIEGAKTPARVLPLPPEGQKAVYVSNLLDQTGALKKLGSIDVTLFRHSTGSLGGIPMAVKMSSDGRSVRPESDYALQAGDRLKVQKAASPAFQGLLNAILGI